MFHANETLYVHDFYMGWVEKWIDNQTRRLSRSSEAMDANKPIRPIWHKQLAEWTSQLSCHTGWCLSTRDPRNHLFIVFSFVLKSCAERSFVDSLSLRPRVSTVEHQRHLSFQLWHMVLQVKHHILQHGGVLKPYISLKQASDSTWLREVVVSFQGYLTSKRKDVIVEIAFLCKTFWLDSQTQNDKNVSTFFLSTTNENLQGLTSISLCCFDKILLCMSRSLLQRYWPTPRDSSGADSWLLLTTAFDLVLSMGSKWERRFYYHPNDFETSFNLITRTDKQNL